MVEDCGIWFDEPMHENMKAMVEFTKEYSVYNLEGRSAGSPLQ